ncbi:hypothetical protein H112_03200 [Trichophyton rubrum D6]|uniref:RNA recognition motif-containing protein n=6 Tax=Trichophyton TaxID=5550 RepID=A0A178EVL4_TRIRU|nr:uncharacterized protein TERG_05812 [Trichophyton rubrum CBS 118892]EZF24337.1 hypothetical protein H100_03204 [Trichophyton rubrum MR850]EZF53940.1 hypothetical protein H103_03212 [Trichophyton rubrum CBS 288.86]EZF64588.1 hypothetical protein H104_03194 [Trichophyton rubrum CBS 289.86]EZF85867.1 hypothetical protein H110_03205 [Trichophyton rubrum MR1448]KDB35132.1 hypothetical protein H112_03200 [Trichophyton rubrum D6]KMQ44090.1 hypothetical protein HL42_5228 [Trichophyton rubrum]
MPPLPGEERLLTVFSDVHYYFTAPSPQPTHHRFDKGSYLYIYHNPSQGGSRIEIANNPGTREQGAFNGSLSSIHLRTSDTFPTLFTLTVDGCRNSMGVSPTTHGSTEHEWRLGWMNPADRSISYFRLHTLDLYFWTLDDAKQFLATVKRLLAPNQLENIQQIQPSSQQAPMSAVVQNLEKVAISDPGYQQQQQHIRPDVHSIKNIPPPPPPPPHPTMQPTPPVIPASVQVVTQPVSPIDDAASHASTTQEKKEAPASYAPLAYNPAAPPAPEPIKPREVTPPPPDAAVGTGLSTPGMGMTFAPPPTGEIESPQPVQPHGVGNVSGSNPQPYTVPGVQGPYSPASSSINQQSYTPGHPPPGGMSFGPPPTTATIPPTAPPTTAASHRGSYGSTFAPPPQDPNAHLYGQQSFGPPPVNQYTQPLAQNHGHLTRRESQASQHSAGGYSYNYPQQQQQPQQQQPRPKDYFIHQQVYNPSGSDQTPTTNTNEPAKYSKLGNGAIRMEKGVNKLFKKLENRI